MARFDAYTATFRGVDPGVAVGLLFGARRAGDEFKKGPGYHRFGEKYGLRAADGVEVGAVLWGGAQADRVMVEVKGERTPELVEALRASVPEHRCTRVDSCEDFDERGAWEHVLAELLQVKAEFDLWGERRGDWDKPEEGRTLIVGAPSSAIRVRCYEKGKQPELRMVGRPDWVRLEIQARPKDAARATYSGLGPEQVWGASKFTRELASRVLHLELAPAPCGTVRRESQRDRALAFMCRQYAKHLVSLKDELGDWACVGLQLGDVLSRERAKYRKGGV